MKTKTLIVIGVIGMAAALAPKARAGWSVGISFAAPVRYSPPVVVYSTPQVCRPPVVYSPPPVAYCPPQTVCVAPRYERHYDYRAYRGHDRDRDRYGWDRRDHDRRGWNNHGRH